jgi:hypothetical protein
LDKKRTSRYSFPGVQRAISWELLRPFLGAEVKDAEAVAQRITLKMEELNQEGQI